MAFEDIGTEEVLDEGVEGQEVAEPEEPQAGAEDPEVAEPESEQPEDGKAATDAAWAKMRRRAEEAERQAAQAQSELDSLKAMQEARELALANMDIDEIDAIAEAAGISRDEVLSNLQREEEAAEAEIQSKEKDLQIKALQERIDEVEAEKAMAQDLAILQKIDPTIKSLEDLGDDFVAYITAGLTAEQAYYAIERKEQSTKPAPAKAPGKITEAAPPEKDYFTEEEVDNMTPEEQKKHHKKIIASMSKW